MTTRFGEIGTYEPSQDWQAYEGRFLFYVEANGVVDDKKKLVVLLSTIGAVAYKVVEDLNAPTALTDDTVTFEKLLEQLRGFYGKKPSTLAARTEFSRLRQRENQTVNEFGVELRNQASRCNFGGELKTRLRDQFVAGVRSETARKRLMERDEIDLDDAEKLARDIERVEREIKTVVGEQSLSQVKQFDRSAREPTTGVQQQRGERATKQESTGAVNNASSSSIQCFRCGGMQHSSNNCPYMVIGWKCPACNTAGHKASMCQAKKQGAYDSGKQSARQFASKQQKHVKAQHDDDDNEGEQTVKNITIQRVGKFSEFKVDVEINGTPLQMELDTGAEATVAAKLKTAEAACVRWRKPCGHQAVRRGGSTSWATSATPHRVSRR